MDAGFLCTDWSAVFDMAVGITDIVAVEDLSAGFSASACGLDLNPTVGGGIRTYQPTLRSFVDISGSLFSFGRRARIDWSSVQGALDVNYTKVSELSFFENLYQKIF